MGILWFHRLPTQVSSPRSATATSSSSFIRSQQDLATTFSQVLGKSLSRILLVMQNHSTMTALATTTSPLAGNVTPLSTSSNTTSSYMLIPMYPRWLRQSGTLCSASVTRRRKRLRNLYGYYSNEPVKGLTPWVSPVMVVPKWNDEIRLCVDMRRANVTIIRECYPIATMDKVLQSLN